MLSRKCPVCKVELQIKFARFVDYYYCSTCDKKYKETELQKGIISSYNFDNLNIVRYCQPSFARNLVCFPGINTSAKKFFSSERLQRYCDEYGFNLIIVSKSIIDKNNLLPHVGNGYRLLTLKILEFLSTTLKLDLEQTDFLSFSHGGVIHVNIITAVKTKTNTFVSSLIPLGSCEILNQNLNYSNSDPNKENKIFIINQKQDSIIFDQGNLMGNFMLKKHNFDVQIIENPKGKHRTWDCRNILFSEMILLNN